jgi:hypothetical protein
MGGSDCLFRFIFTASAKKGKRSGSRKRQNVFGDGSATTAFCAPVVVPPLQQLQKGKCIPVSEYVCCALYIHVHLTTLIEIHKLARKATRDHSVANRRILDTSRYPHPTIPFERAASKANSAQGAGQEALNNQKLQVPKHINSYILHFLISCQIATAPKK